MRGADVGVMRGAGVAVMRGAGVGVTRGVGVGVMRGAGVEVLCGAGVRVLRCARVRVMRGAGVGRMRGARVGVMRGAGVGVMRGAGSGVMCGAGVGVMRGAGVGVMRVAGVNRLGPKGSQLGDPNPTFLCHPPRLPEPRRRAVLGVLQEVPDAPLGTQELRERGAGPERSNGMYPHGAHGVKHISGVYVCCDKHLDELRHNEKTSIIPTFECVHIGTMGQACERSACAL